MATQRLVSTNFWKDTYVIDLDPVQKLLFIYFLTNPRTNLAGVYELSVREAAFDTGIDKDMVQKILDKFCRDGKMHHEHGWLILRNFVKHQRLNPSIAKGIEKIYTELPDWLKNMYDSYSIYNVEQGAIKTDYLQTDTSLGTDWGESNIIKSNIIKSNPIESNPIKANASESPAQARAEKIPTETITEFLAYWLNTVGFEIGNEAANRKAIAALIRQRGIDGLRRLVQGVAKSHEDKFAPRISDYVSLKRKQNDLIVWGKKKGVNNGIAQF